MLVDESRVDEYIALGYQKAGTATVIDKTEKAEEKPKKVATKKVTKKK